jgi:hypothetical protein
LILHIVSLSCDIHLQNNITNIHRFQASIPTGRGPFFGPFLKFGQAIVDVIFVQKISNFWRTCDLVLASRSTNFYKIPIFGDTVMPQKHIFLVLRATSSSQKAFYILTFLGWIIFINS